MNFMTFVFYEIAPIVCVVFFVYGLALDLLVRKGYWNEQ